MAEDLYAFFKVGDQETAAGKEYLGMKDGMLVCFIDPNEWNPVISDEAKKIFMVAKVPYAWKSDLVSGTAPNQDPGKETQATFRQRNKLVTFSEIESATGKADLEADLRGSKVVDIVDLTAQLPTILKDSATLNAPALDVNAITSGAANVGSGETYTTLALAFSDLGNLTGNLTFTITSDITETARSTITEDLGGFTLLITSDTPNNGDPTAGWTITWNFNLHGMSDQAEGPGILEYENFHIVATATVNNNAKGYFSTDTVIVAHTFKIHDGTGDITGATLGQFADFGDATTIIEMWNIAGSGGNTDFIQRRNGNAADLFENITVIDSDWNGIDMSAETEPTVRNCVVTGSANADFVNIGGATGRNNMDSDGTGANGNWGTGTGNGTVTAANEFVSESIASPYFGKAKSGATIDNGGVAPSIAGNTLGIRGNDRPGGDGAYSIGADEFAIVTFRRRMEES